MWFGSLTVSRSHAKCGHTYDTNTTLSLSLYRSPFVPLFYLSSYTSLNAPLTALLFLRLIRFVDRRQNGFLTMHLAEQPCTAVKQRLRHSTILLPFAAAQAEVTAALSVLHSSLKADMVSSQALLSTQQSTVMAQAQTALTNQHTATSTAQAQLFTTLSTQVWSPDRCSENDRKVDVREKIIFTYKVDRPPSFPDGL